MSDDAAALTESAKARRLKGDLQGALDDARRAIESQPGFSEAYLERAETRAALGVQARRKASVNDALRSVTVITGPDAASEDFRSPGSSLFDAALTDYRKVIELDPQRTDALLGSSRMKAALDNWSGAQADLEQYLAKSPSNPQAWAESAAILRLLKNRVLAEEHYTKRIELEPTSPGAYADRGLNRLDLVQFETALQDFEKALTLDPENRLARFGRARVRAGLDPEAARKDYLALATEDPKDLLGLYVRGLAAESLGDRAAGTWFAKASELVSPWDPIRVDLAQGGAVQSPSFRLRLKETPLTFVLAAVNIGVFAIAESQGNTLESETLLRFGATWRWNVWSGEYWRLFTSIFLHIGVTHLVWNTIAMFGWCASVERALGSARFLLAYVLTGVAASALSVLSWDVVSAGASGSGFGMIGLLLVHAYVKAGGGAAFFGNPRVRKTIGWIAVWFILGLTAVPMDNYAHLGGLLSGLALGILFFRSPRFTPRSRRIAWTAFGLVFAALTVSSCFPLLGNTKEFSSHRDATAGHAALFNGDPVRAEQLLSRAIEEGLRTAEVYANRGIARQRLGRSKDAEDDYEAALRINADLVDALWGRGALRAQRGDAKGALTDFNRAIELNPKDPGLYLNRAALRLDAGDRAGAISDYRSALGCAPKDWDKRQETEDWLRAMDGK